MDILFETFNYAAYFKTSYLITERAYPPLLRWSFFFFFPFSSRWLLLKKAGAKYIAVRTYGAKNPYEPSLHACFGALQGSTFRHKGVLWISSIADIGFRIHGNLQLWVECVGQLAPLGGNGWCSTPLKIIRMVKVGSVEAHSYVRTSSSSVAAYRGLVPCHRIRSANHWKL